MQGPSSTLARAFFELPMSSVTKRSVFTRQHKFGASHPSSTWEMPACSNSAFLTFAMNSLPPPLPIFESPSNTDVSTRMARHSVASGTHSLVIGMHKRAQGGTRNFPYRPQVVAISIGYHWVLHPSQVFGRDGFGEGGEFAAYVLHVYVACHMVRKNFARGRTFK